LASAAAFGVTTPLVQRLVRRDDVGTFVTAACLYLGAALFGAATRSKREAAPSWRQHGPRLVLVALSGALAAPVLLAWGLARTSGTASALMLNLEAFFTIALARLLYREHVGGRIALAALVLFTGGALLIADHATHTSGSLLGLLAVGGASLAWAFDNALAKPLSMLDPARVVAWKGLAGAGASLGLALVFERIVPSMALVALVALGATGYGASLKLYLIAQRRIGAGRTASVFAIGPFLGAALAWALGEPAGPLTAVSAVAMLVGLYLHSTERHGHPHEHAPIVHEHAHRHDDGHHDHHHDPMPEGEHTHEHAHDRRVHDHPHLPDAHHDHAHG
jgi:drug/metabolite transporter (DMT)-like permease